jgi:hypothetical protein
MKNRDSRGNNCNVLQEGNNPADHSHCKKQTPMQARRLEIMGTRSIALI